MPVLYLGRNVNHISRVQFLSGFAPLLIITPTRRTKKDLTAVMVDVPVVPALNWAQRSRWKQARPYHSGGTDNWPR